MSHAPTPASDGPTIVDVAVVGAGFGGLGVALRAAELGHRVALFESLAYPGGCASTFRRGGVSYEAGATLFAGLGDDGFSSGASPPNGLRAPVRLLDPVLHVRTPDFELDVPADRASFVAIAERYPALARATVQEMTASPRTFARFVGRPEGYVGGVPRRVGLHNDRTLGPRPVLPGVWLVGDTAFPGQSILAAAIGGWKTAEALPHAAAPAVSRAAASRAGRA